MTNHFHLVIQTPEPNLSRDMQWLNGTYADSFNRRHKRAGHLFQGRFHAFIERELGAATHAQGLANTFLVSFIWPGRKELGGGRDPVP